MTKIESVVHHSPFNIALTVRNTDGTKTYTINLMFFLNEDRWEATWCSCKGFGNWMKCKHVDSVREYIDKLPRPTSPGPKLKLVGYWYQCEFCKNNSFILFPPLNKHAVTQAACSKCGRAYEVI